jgi:hypothetical protein
VFADEKLDLPFWEAFSYSLGYCFPIDLEVFPYGFAFLAYLAKVTEIPA